MKQRTSSSRAATLCAVALAVGVVVIPAPPATSSIASGGPSFSWQLFDDFGGGELVGLDLVSSDVAWVTDWGTRIFRTTDGGETFTDIAPDDAAELGMQFVDVEALSEDTAIAVAVLPDDPDRLYRTSDGGASWTITHQSEAASYYNCVAMFDRRRGFVMGDPVDGEFEVLVTDDSGRSWDRVPGEDLPDPLVDEYGATFGGECAAATQNRGFFGTGFAEESRVFRTEDFGATWEVSSTGTGDLVNALEFKNNSLGLATGVGLMRTTDGGITWEPADAVAGFRSDIAWYHDRRGDQRSTGTGDAKIVFAIGPEGTDVSVDRGQTFERFDTGAFYSMDCLKRTTTCWASGPEGRIGQLTVA